MTAPDPLEEAFDAALDAPGWENGDTPQTIIRAALRAAAPVIERDAFLRATDAFTEHYLAHIECDHKRGRDKPWCACSRVNLGWHQSVGTAVVAWSAHVLGVLRERAAVHRKGNGDG